MYTKILYSYGPEIFWVDVQTVVVASRNMHLKNARPYLAFRNVYPMNSPIL